jgi:hypothetical protein
VNVVSAFVSWRTLPWCFPMEHADSARGHFELGSFLPDGFGSAAGTAKPFAEQTGPRPGPQHSSRLDRHAGARAMLPLVQPVCNRPPIES